MLFLIIFSYQVYFQIKLFKFLNMGHKNSTQEKQKFQFIDTDDAQQFQFRPTSQLNSLETHKQITSATQQGPTNGDVGQYTGLSQFIVPEKYLKFMQQNPIECDKPNIQGTSGFDPYMFRKSLNVYFGQWKNSKPHGYGKIFNPDRDFYYEGYFQYGLPSYYGIFVTNDSSYKGKLKLGHAEGTGVYRQKQTIIEGEFRQNYPSQNCTQKGPNYIFTGDYENGKWKKGRLLWDNQTSVYDGDFQNGLMHGKGILKTNEYIYQGDFLNGKKNGLGNIIWKTGEMYKGEFLDDQISGNGEFYRENKLVYRGQFQNGKAKGQGCISSSEKLIYANWNDGQANQIS